METPYQTISKAVVTKEANCADLQPYLYLFLKEAEKCMTKKILNKIPRVLKVFRGIAVFHFVISLLGFTDAGGPDPAQVFQGHIDYSVFACILLCVSQVLCIRAQTQNAENLLNGLFKLLQIFRIFALLNFVILSPINFFAFQRNAASFNVDERFFQQGRVNYWILSGIVLLIAHALCMAVKVELANCGNNDDHG